LIQRYAEGPLNPLLYVLIILRCGGGLLAAQLDANLVGAWLVLLVVVLSRRRGRAVDGCRPVEHPSNPSLRVAKLIPLRANRV
jgi:hypothetical protein